MFCVREDEDRREVAAVTTTTASGAFLLPVGQYTLLGRNGGSVVHREDTPVEAFLLVVRAPGFRPFVRSLQLSDLGASPLDALLEPSPRGTGVRASLLLPHTRAPASGVRVLVRLDLSSRQEQGRLLGEAQAPSAVPTRGRVAWSLVSDAEGRIELAGVPPGSATLVVAGGQSYVRTTTALSRDRETSIQLEVGAELHLTIEGLDPRLTLRREGALDSVSFFPGAKSSYAIRGLSPGRYRLTAAFRPSDADGHSLPALVEDLDLTAGYPQRIRVRAPSPETAASLRVRVLNAKGEPLAGRRVVAARADADRFGLTSSLVTDARGEVWLQALAPATYRVRVQGCLQQEVALAARAQRALVVRPSAARVLESQVVDPSGRPVQGAQVTAGFAEGKTDAEGRFRLELAGLLPEGTRVDLVLDASFGAVGGGRTLPSGTRLARASLGVLVKGRPWRLICAARPEETAIERGAPRQGLFTEWLLALAVGPGDANEDGRVSLGEAWRFLSRWVTPDAREAGAEQRPCIWGGDYEPLLAGPEQRSHALTRDRRTDLGAGEPPTGGSPSRTEHEHEHERLSRNWQFSTRRSRRLAESRRGRKLGRRRSDSVARPRELTREEGKDPRSVLLRTGTARRPNALAANPEHLLDLLISAALGVPLRFSALRAALASGTPPTQSSRAVH
ncbi:MAG: carboxypeptidase regulatory-like domain-containing protein [Planctomycetes bacterium]|nr:carboxypeptidase regulatory-like domain-containing protein [Planctomycetota bacterium]